MPDFFKGVGIGTYLHDQNRDPRLYGISPNKPGIHDVADMINHIGNATTWSPYISLTRSYEVAENYARQASRIKPTSQERPYVFRIRIPDPAPTGLTVYDPVAEILKTVPNPLDAVSYQHNGGMDAIIGIAQPRTRRGIAILSRPVKLYGGTTGISGPNISQELNAMTRALRDSEILCLGVIPASLIIDRHEV